MKEKSSKTNTYKAIFTCIIILFAFGCKKKSFSDLKLGVQEDLDACSLMADSQKKGDCQNLVTAIIENDTINRYSEMGSQYIDRFFSQPKTLKLGDKCLHNTSGGISLQPCQDYESHSRWHLVNVEVEYRWGEGPTLWGKAFHLVTRDSVRRWAQHDPRSEASPTLECATIGSEISDSSEVNQTYSVEIAPCAESKILFLTVPNDVQGDANLYGARWTRVIALDLTNPQFSNVKEAMATYKANLTKACEEGCLSQMPVQETRVNLGDIKWIPSTYSLVRSVDNKNIDPALKDLLTLLRNDGEAVPHPTDDPSSTPKGKQNKMKFHWEWTLGGCVNSRYDEESSCFVSPDQMIQLGTYKKLYHASLEQEKGYVVQVRENGQCLLWNGSTVNCEQTKDIDKGTGANASQYRLSFVQSPENFSEPFVQLQRVQSDQAKTFKCLNLKTKKEVDCCTGDNQCSEQNSYMVRGKKIYDIEDQDKPYDLHPCVVASSTQQNFAYDCVDYIDPKWAKFQLIADIIGYIPILGSIPAYVLEGMICTSGEMTMAKSACMSVTIGVAIDLALLPLDLMGFIGTSSEVLEQLITKGAVKANSSLAMDFTTDPVLASLAYYTAKRTFRQMQKTIAAEGLEQAAKEMTEPVTRSIVQRMMKNGIQGSQSALSFSGPRVDQIIRGAANAAVNTL